jgi:hypothetical protein
MVTGAPIKTDAHTSVLRPFPSKTDYLRLARHRE